MKTIHKQKYHCPSCGKNFVYNEWSEETPEEDCLCDKCFQEKHPSVIGFINPPSWTSVAKRAMPDPRKMDADGESRATDYMLEERTKETSLSAKARRWEEGRKKEWQGNKPAWRKDRAQKEQNKRESIAREVLRKY